MDLVCSPRQRMPFESRTEGLEMRWVTCRALSARPYLAALFSGPLAGLMGPLLGGMAGSPGGGLGDNGVGDESFGYTGDVSKPDRVLESIDPRFR
jgi:hypothetical protein